MDTLAILNVQARLLQQLTDLYKHINSCSRVS